MNSKNLTILLAVLLAAAVTYIFILRSTLSDNGDENGIGQRGLEQQSSQLEDCCEEPDSLLVAQWKRARRVHPDTTGKFVSRDSAASQFLRYFHSRPSNQPYGFAFGLEKLRTLIENIDTKNGSMSPGDTSRIAGVRVYLVKRFSKLRNGTKKRHTDVLFVPVKASGYNFIGISDPIGGKSVPPNDPPLLLNTSSPCPDMCD